MQVGLRDDLLRILFHELRPLFPYHFLTDFRAVATTIEIHQWVEPFRLPALIFGQPGLTARIQVSSYLNSGTIRHREAGP